MASVRRRGSTVRVKLDAAESALLAGLAHEVRSMLQPAENDTDDADPLEQLVGLSSSPVSTPDDPAVRRLLPDAYADGEAAAEFRRLTDSDLRDTKANQLQRIVDTVGEQSTVVLDDDDAVAWLHGLADIRLVLAQRLDITEETDLDPTRSDESDPRFAQLAIYDWLAWLQDAMVNAVSTG